MGLIVDLVFVHLRCCLLSCVCCLMIRFVVVCYCKIYLIWFGLFRVVFSVLVLLAVELVRLLDCFLISVCYLILRFVRVC